ncbi:MAG: tetratricopeptide repeat protein [bacterium]
MSDVFARRQFERGRQFELQDKLEEAVRAYEAACSMKPGFPDAYFALGRIEANRNHFEAALGLFDQALAISTDPQIREWRAYVCGRLRRYDEALADYRAVVEAGEHQARVNLGRMLLALRRYDEAEEALKGAEDPSSQVLLAALPRYREFTAGERVDDLRAVRYLFATNIVLGTFGDGGLTPNPRRYLLLTPVHIALTVRRLLALVERRGWRFDGVAGSGPHHGPVARLCAHALGTELLTAAPGPGCRVLLCSAILKSVAEARAVEASWRERGVRLLHFALGLVPEGDPDTAEPEILGWVGRSAVPWHRVEPMSRLEPDASVTDGQWPGFRVGPPIVDPNQERVSAGLIEAFEEGRRDVALREVME